MDKVVCSVCNVALKNMKCYVKHTKSKKHVIKCSNQTTNDMSEYSCDCGKTYKYRQGLSLHKKTCNYKVSYNKDNTIIDDKLHKLASEIELERRSHEEERQELKNHITVLMEKLSQNIHPLTNIETQNIETQNNVTININAFGSENLDYITDKVIVNCIGRVYNSIPILIEKIHFDPEHPENHNIKITNKKLPYASVMTKDNDWKIIDKNTVIESMVHKSYDMLDISYKNNKNDLGSPTQKQFEEFQTRYTNEDKDTMRNVKKNVELKIINKPL